MKHNNINFLLFILIFVVICGACLRYIQYRIDTKAGSKTLLIDEYTGDITFFGKMSIPEDLMPGKFSLYHRGKHGTFIIQDKTGHIKCVYGLLDDFEDGEVIELFDGDTISYSGSQKGIILRALYSQP